MPSKNKLLLSCPRCPHLNFKVQKYAKDKKHQKISLTVIQKIMESQKIDKIYLSLIYHEELNIAFACRRPLTFKEVKDHVDKACEDYDTNYGLVKDLIDKNEIPTPPYLD